MASLQSLRSFPGPLVLAACCTPGETPTTPAQAGADPAPSVASEPMDPVTSSPMPDPQNLTDEKWRGMLDPMAYRVLRESATERPFTGHLLDEKRDGTFTCGGCGFELFASDQKFDSGCGWPGFSAPLADSAIREVSDSSHGMQRVEVRCPKCDGHLGHVFEDGPAPTGLRYCINSAALEFDPAEGESPAGE